MADTQDHIAKLGELQRQFAEQLDSRFEEIDRAWTRVKTSADQPQELRMDLLRLVHSLAGTAGTFAYTALGSRARKLEEWLQACNKECDLNADEQAFVDQALIELRALAGQGADSSYSEPIVSKDQPSPQNKSGVVYILEDDISLAKDMALQLRQYGYQVKVYENASSLKAAYERQLPIALLADIFLPEGALEGPRIALELQEGLPAPVPIVFISGRDDWPARLAAVRAGGLAYFSKPVDVLALVEQLDKLSGFRSHEPYRILIVEDTQLLAEHYAAVLQAAGMETEIVTDPTTLYDVLPSFRPELLLMDIFMPGCSGVEVAQVLRQHPGYVNLPIVYLSTETVLHQQLEALRSGGDDFLEKPIKDVHLVAAVEIRVHRFRQIHSLMNRDSLTGLLNHVNFKRELDRELAQAQRRDGCVSIALLDIDHFKGINDCYGHPVGDRVIKSLARLMAMRLRKADIAARYGGEEFAVILTDTESDGALVLMDELRQAFADLCHVHEPDEFHVTLSAGIASSRQYSSMEALIEAADQALYGAKREGRNQVKHSQ